LINNGKWEGNYLLIYKTYFHILINNNGKWVCKY
jgi:hypothetical protein